MTQDRYLKSLLSAAGYKLTEIDLPNDWTNIVATGPRGRFRICYDFVADKVAVFKRKGRVSYSDTFKRLTDAETAFKQITGIRLK